MKYLRLLLLGLVSVVIVGGISTLLMTTTTVIEPKLPDVADKDRIRLDHGLVTVEQSLVIPASANEVGMQLWVQQLPGHFPFLTVRADSYGTSYGPVRVELPPADGQFHSVQLPWWRVTSGHNKMRLTVRGHAVLVSTSRQSGIEPYETNGVPSQDTGLLVHIKSRQGGLEQYLPLLRAAEGKPGFLGWPKAFLVVMLLAAITVLSLLFSSLRLVKAVDEEYAHLQNDGRSEQQMT